MRKQDFYDEIKEIMEIEDEIVDSTKLKDYEEFDSLAVMSLIALINSKFGRRIPGTVLQNVQTPAELVTLIGVENFD